MRVGYVIVRENLHDPLIQSQCYDVVEVIANSWTSGEVVLIWFYRIDYLFRKKNPRLTQLRRELSSRGIRSRFIPFLSLGFPVSWWALPLVTPQWFLGLLYLRYAQGIRSLHCRSYHAGFLGYVASKLLRMNYVFDPRSPFAEENVSAKRWRQHSLNHRIWKNLETDIINNSNSTILVSPRLRDFYRDLQSKHHFRVIANNYPAAFEPKLIADQGKKPKNYTLVYVGSFGNWNRPGPYLRLLSIINQISQEKCNFLFIVRTDSAVVIEQQAQKYCVSRSLFDIVSVAQSQVADYLEQCRYGVYLMGSRDPRLGVKTVEYLAMGVPVIVSKNILGASDLVQSEGLGVTWDHSEDGARAVYDWMQMSSSELAVCANRCQGFAKENFSPWVVAAELVKVYEEMVNYE